MISKVHRFHGYSSLRYVYRHGYTVRDRHFSLRYIVNTRRSTYRASVIVSRKVLKSAVSRNRLRRRIYEIIRSHEAEIIAPFDIVLTVYSELLDERSPDELDSDIARALMKAGILPPGNDTSQPNSHDIVDAKGDG